MLAIVYLFIFFIFWGVVFSVCNIQNALKIKIFTVMKNPTFAWGLTLEQNFEKFYLKPSTGHLEVAESILINNDITNITCA